MRRVCRFLLMTLGTLGLPSLFAWEADDARLAELDRRAQHLADRRIPTEYEIRQFAELVDSLGREFPADPVSLWWEAVRLDRTRNETEAASMLEAVLAEADPPRDSIQAEAVTRAATLLGTIRLGEGRPVDAYQLAQRAITLAPRSTPAYQLLLDAGFEAGRWDEVRQILARACADVSAVTDDLLELYLEVLWLSGDSEELGEWIPRRWEVDRTCPVAHHFWANACSKDRSWSAVGPSHLISVINGRPDSAAVIRSTDAMSRHVVARLSAPIEESADLTWVVEMIARFEVGLRRGIPVDSVQLEETRQAMDQLPVPSDEWSRLIMDYSRASVGTLSSNPEQSLDRWKSLVDRYPKFIPALCRWAEVLEAVGDESSAKEAERLWQQARSWRGEHPLVRDRFRLGIEIAMEPDGVRVMHLEPDSPLGELGLADGDVIVRVNDAPLPASSAVWSRRHVLLFSGGTINWRTKAGKLREAEVPILILE